MPDSVAFFQVTHGLLLTPARAVRNRWFRGISVVLIIVQICIQGSFRWDRPESQIKTVCITPKPI